MKKNKYIFANIVKTVLLLHLQAQKEIKNNHLETDAKL